MYLIEGKIAYKIFFKINTGEFVKIKFFNNG